MFLFSPRTSLMSSQFCFFFSIWRRGVELPEQPGQFPRYYVKNISYLESSCSQISSDYLRKAIARMWLSPNCWLAHLLSGLPPVVLSVLFNYQSVTEQLGAVQNTPSQRKSPVRIFKKDTLGPKHRHFRGQLKIGNWTRSKDTSFYKEIIQTVGGGGNCF